MTDQYKKNPNISISDFSKYANIYYNDNQFKIKIFKVTWFNLFNKIKKNIR